jgi:hypothetical protein
MDQAGNLTNFNPKICKPESLQNYDNFHPKICKPDSLRSYDNKTEKKHNAVMQQDRRALMNNWELEKKFITRRPKQLGR